MYYNYIFSEKNESKRQFRIPLYRNIMKYGTYCRVEYLYENNIITDYKKLPITQSINYEIIYNKSIEMRIYVILLCQNVYSEII